MAYATPLKVIGGTGGTLFSFTGENSGATLQKLGVWIEGWQVKSVKAWLTDGTSEAFGNPGGDYKEYSFTPGECFTSLSLWGNEAGTHLGAVKFTTNCSGEFFANTTDLGLRTEHSVDVGSGICLGVVGSCGADVDSMGFMFLNVVKTTVLMDVSYPTIQEFVPEVNEEEIKSITFLNNTTRHHEHTIESSKKITKTSSWTVANGMESTFSVEVRAGIPKVVEAPTGFIFFLGKESSRQLENTEEKTKTLIFPVQVPAGKKMRADITIGRATVSLPYTGTVVITCENGGVLQCTTSGVYEGITYASIKGNVKEI